jgi:hypothetical protein
MVLKNDTCQSGYGIYHQVYAQHLIVKPSITPHWVK